MHDRHRTRVRDRFLKEGLDAFEPHQVLELLLFFSIPRVDTNPTAHRLLETFGSFAGVLDASYQDLLKVEGIGPSSAMLLHLIAPICKRYELDRSHKLRKLTNIKDVCEYAKTLFMGTKKEQVYLLCFNARQELTGTHRLAEGSFDAVHVPIVTLANIVLKDGCRTIILAHNHPGGLACFSNEDFAYTLQIKNTLEPLGVDLVDHLLSNEYECISMIQTENGWHNIF